MRHSAGTRALILQHQDDAPAGLLLESLQAADVSWQTVHLDRGDVLPDPGSVEFAVSLGSDLSAGEDEQEWVAREIDWLRAADGAGTPVLGLCFGGQALAVALGGGVAPGAGPERGWVGLQTRRPELIAAGPWLTWHDDVIELPPQAELLARNDSGPQAFRVGRHLGVQFHPEVTPQIFGDWIAHSSEDGLNGLDGEAILARARHEFPRAAAEADRLFTRFIASARAARW